MIGFISRMYSPSSEQSSRNTPWVAGWCGPRLTVKISCSRSTSTSRSAPVPKTGPSRAPVSFATSRSLIPARHFVFVEREDDRLAADREIASLRVAHVVLRHQETAHVRVALEDDAEHVVDLAL